MTKVVGVRFRQVGKIYFFAPGKYSVEVGQHVIVETARGVEYGSVVLGEREVEDSDVVQPLKAIIRIATLEDDEREAKNREKEKEAYKICLEKIKKHNLTMKLIKVEYTFDNNKVLFYFTADGRIDFRELVKDLASVFKTRIELRQIGVRELFNRFMMLLERDFKISRDVNYYARQMNISSKYLTNIVSQVTGHTPKTIIDQYVILQLKMQLKRSTQSVKEMAWEFHFADVSFFCQDIIPHRHPWHQKWRTLLYRVAHSVRWHPRLE